MSRVLAVIKAIDFGLRDVGVPCIWFTTYTSRATAALQCITGMERITDFFKEADCYSFKELEGKTCWAEETDGMIKFIDVSNI